AKLVEHQVAGHVGTVPPGQKPCQTQLANTAPRYARRLSPGGVWPYSCSSMALSSAARSRRNGAQSELVDSANQAGNIMPENIQPWPNVCFLSSISPLRKSVEDMHCPRRSAKYFEPRASMRPPSVS